MQQVKVSCSHDMMYFCLSMIVKLAACEKAKELCLLSAIPSGDESAYEESGL
jgi:hypothetical protein